MLWNTRNAKLARKSLAESRPAAGLRVKPVFSAKIINNVKLIGGKKWIINIDNKILVVRRTAEEVGHFLELRDLVLVEDTLVLEFLEHGLIFLTEVFGH